MQDPPDSSNAAWLDDSFFERYLPGLRAYLNTRLDRSIRERENMSDIAQTICREFLRQAHKLGRTPTSDREIWFRLKREADQKLIERHRMYTTGSRNRGKAPAPLDSPEAQDTPSKTPEPASTASDREEKMRLEAAIRDLPQPHRRVVELAYFDGKSRDQIAEEIGRSVGATKMLLARALTQLSRSLKSSGDA